MATTTFVDGQTVISADWLNDVDEAVYNPASIPVAAENVSITTISTIAATDVQGALAEIVAEKQPLNGQLTALGTSTAAADKIPYFTGTTTAGTLTWNSASALANDATTVSSNTVIKAAIDAMDIDTQVAPGTSGNVLTSNGTIWTSAALGARIKAFAAWDATRNASGGSDTANTTRYLRSSSNVSSVTKTADGAFTIAISGSVVSDGEYCVQASMKGVSGGSGYAVPLVAGTPSSTSLDIITVAPGSGGGLNSAYNYVAIIA